MVERGFIQGAKEIHFPKSNRPNCTVHLCLLHDDCDSDVTRGALLTDRQRRGRRVQGGVMFRTGLRTAVCAWLMMHTAAGDSETPWLTPSAPRLRVGGNSAFQ
jgi:hypothetical protein